MKHPDKIVSSKRDPLEEYPLIAHLIERGVVMDTYDLRAEVFRMADELKKSHEALEQSNRELKQSYIEQEKKRYDHLTGFLLRGEWYDEFKAIVIRAFDLLRQLDNDNADDSQSIAVLVQASSALQYNDVSLFFGDVALLKFANYFGESYGDAIIKLTVRYIHKYLSFKKTSDYTSSNSVLGRHGGDEFVGVCTGQSMLTIRHQMKLFVSNFERHDVSSDLPHFFECGIPPCFDVGSATLEEACFLTAEVIRQELTGGKNHMELLLNKFIDIADGRSRVSKAISHITLVTTLLQGIFTGNSERYWILRPYILKGCIGVSASRLGIFLIVKTFCSKETFDAVVLKYVLNKMEKNVRKHPVSALIMKTVLQPWKEQMK